jgi:hypothetical protein
MESSKSAPQDHIVFYASIPLTNAESATKRFPDISQYISQGLVNDGAQ